MVGRFEDDGHRSDMLGFEEIFKKPDNLYPQLPDKHIKERRLGKMTDRAAGLEALIETLEAQWPTIGDADAANPNSPPCYDANRFVAEAMKASESVMSSSLPEHVGLSSQERFQVRDLPRVRELAKQAGVKVGDIVMPEPREDNLVTKYGGIHIESALVTLIPERAGAMENFWRNYVPSSDRNAPKVNQQALKQEMLEMLDARAAARSAEPIEQPNVAVVNRLDYDL